MPAVASPTVASPSPINSYEGRSKGRNSARRRARPRAPESSREADSDAVECDAFRLRRPGLPRRDGKRARQRPSGHDLAGSEWRIDRIVGQNLDQVPQCRYWSAQDIRRPPLIDDRSVALEVDVKCREVPLPVVAGVRKSAPRTDDEPPVQAVRRHRVW